MNAGPVSQSLSGGRDSMVPSGEVRSYYNRPVIKQPVWTWEIPWYFFTGGLAGASATLAAAARRAGNAELARVARRGAAAATVASPPLLIADLGRPERFHHMLRVFKPTSPMNMGSWLLTVFGTAAVGSAGLAELGGLPAWQRAAERVAAALGPVMATYTAVLFADTAVPVWHAARQELPLVFAGGAAASAGALSTAFADTQRAGPARRLAVTGALLELGAAEVMQRRLGDLGEPYRSGDSGRYARLARGLTTAGAAMLGLLGRRRGGAVLGAGLTLAGAVCQRWAVYRAGFASARDPKYVVADQRARLQARTTAPT